jgi:hypothetical protein
VLVQEGLLSNFQNLLLQIFIIAQCKFPTVWIYDLLRFFSLSSWIRWSCKMSSLSLMGWWSIQTNLDHYLHHHSYFFCNNGDLNWLCDCVSIIIIMILICYLICILLISTDSWHINLVDFLITMLSLVCFLFTMLIIKLLLSGKIDIYLKL